MKKVKCSKYPEEKCKYAENRTFEKCETCKYNLYRDLASLQSLKDCFQKC